MQLDGAARTKLHIAGSVAGGTGVDGSLKAATLFWLFLSCVAF